MQDLELAVKFQVHLTHDEKAKVYVGFIPRLGVYSQGKSMEEAQRAIGSAASLYLQIAFEMGILDKTLKRLGVVPAPSPTPFAVEPSGPTFTVPILTAA